MFLEAVDQRNRKLAVHDVPLGDHDQSELVVHSALDPMASEAKIDVLLTAEVHVVLKARSHKLVNNKFIINFLLYCHEICKEKDGFEGSCF